MPVQLSTSDFAIVYMEELCGYYLSIPCDRSDAKRAGTLRFRYGRLPRKEPSEYGTKHCILTIQVDAKLCLDAGLLSIHAHVK